MLIILDRIIMKFMLCGRERDKKLIRGSFKNFLFYFYNSPMAKKRSLSAEKTSIDKYKPFMI